MFYTVGVHISYPHCRTHTLLCHLLVVSFTTPPPSHQLPRAGPAPVVMAEVPVDQCLTAQYALHDTHVGPVLADLLREGVIDENMVVVVYLMLQRCVWAWVGVFFSEGCVYVLS